jgi:hypothetical protein
MALPREVSGVKKPVPSPRAQDEAAGVVDDAHGDRGAQLLRFRLRRAQRAHRHREGHVRHVASPVRSVKVRAQRTIRFASVAM